MPEAYWAAIATLVVMQSTLGATLTLSLERIVTTALVASVGALEAKFFEASLVALALVLLGLLSIAFRLEKTAYRYASITLAIIVLIPRTAARGPSRSIGSLKSQSESSLLSPWWRLGQSINGFRPMAPLSRGSVAAALA